MWKHNEIRLWSVLRLCIGLLLVNASDNTVHACHHCEQMAEQLIHFSPQGRQVPPSASHQMHYPHALPRTLVHHTPTMHPTVMVPLSPVVHLDPSPAATPHAAAASSTNSSMFQVIISARQPSTPPSSHPATSSHMPMWPAATSALQHLVAWAQVDRCCTADGELVLQHSA